MGDTSVEQLGDAIVSRVGRVDVYIFLHVCKGAEEFESLISVLMVEDRRSKSGSHETNRYPTHVP